MNDLVIGLLSALMATNQPAAISNLIHQKTGAKIEITDPNDPVERAYRKLMLDDDAAQDEVNRWIDDRNRAAVPMTDVEKAALQARIRDRYEKIKQSYDEFLKLHPNHVNARIAYGSFLSEIGEEEASAVQLEKATQIDPKNPAAWNNLANFHGHSGDVKKAFQYYARAIEIEPTESLYHQNFATTVFLFRKDAMEFYQITEQQVFEKALAEYRRALELDSSNFLLASEVAQTYYGVKPAKSEDAEQNRKNELKLADEALASWRRALDLAGDSLQREGAQIHLARWQITAGRFDAARDLLTTVTNPVLAATRARVLKNLESRDSANKATNTVKDAAKPLPK